MKLQTKIQLFSSVFMLILLLLINTTTYFMFYKVSATSDLNELAVQTDMIVEGLNENNDIGEAELLKAFLPSDGMIRVIGKEEEAVIPTLTKKNDYRTLASVYTTKESKSLEKSETKENIAVINKPIIWNDGEVVTLQVSKHLVSLQDDMRTLLFVLLIVSLVMLVPTYIAASILSRFLLKPIKSLTIAMRENTTQTEFKKITELNESKDELYEMEKTFNDMIDQLQENFNKQETFVSDASHELKTPISIVKSYAQLLSRRGLDHPDLFHESVEAIESEADRMQKLVEQMLNLAKNQVNNTFSNVDITLLCTEITKVFHGATNRSVYLTHNNEELIVSGNHDHLEQVIYILIDNALKYSEASIDLKLHGIGGSIILTVTDYGQGISVEDQKHIFDRFYRVDKARSRETGGTGLGLPIAKAIAQSHDGELTVNSIVGKGTTFTLKLPQINRN